MQNEIIRQEKLEKYLEKQKLAEERKNAIEQKKNKLMEIKKIEILNEEKRRK